MTEKLFCLDPSHLHSCLAFLVITKAASDFPEHYCVRAQVVYGSQILYGRFAGLYDNLEQARADVPEFAHRFPRAEEEDPVIVETWML